jgi:tetratricopeptide (TPR) repeat protein
MNKYDQRGQKVNTQINAEVVNVNLDIDNANAERILEAIAKTSFSTDPPIIPAPVKDFTGRESQINELKSKLAQGELVIGISGGGGIGKTQLARKLAIEIKESFPDAQLEIDLHGTLEDPISSYEAMRILLSNFHEKLPDDVNQLEALYQRTFSTKKCLLLLDNAANPNQVRPLILSAPSTVIITSRTHFSLSEFGLKEPLRLNVFSPLDAQALLKTSISKLQELHIEELDELSRLCGYLPLALRVAVSLLNDSPNWTLNTLIKRLEDEKTRLKNLKREGDEVLDVEAVLGLSYNLLAPDLQKYFRMLAVFTAPFPLFSAQAVLSVEEETLEDELNKLVNRNLLYIFPPRGYLKTFSYFFHDLTRLYATKILLEDKEETKQAVTNHAKHYLRWAGAANSFYVKGNEHTIKGLQALSAVWQHLMAAFQRCLPDPNIFPRPTIADSWLSEFPLRCGNVLDVFILPKQRINIVQNALEASRRLENKEDEAGNLQHLGEIYRAVGKTHEAIELDQQTLAIWRATGNRREEAAILCNMGIAYGDLDQLETAIDLCEQSKTIAIEVGARDLESSALRCLADSNLSLKNFDKAIEYYLKSLAIDIELGNLRGQGTTIGNLGVLYLRTDKLDKSVECSAKFLAISLGLGDEIGATNARATLGFALSDMGNYEKSLLFLEKALLDSKEIGDEDLTQSLQREISIVKIKISDQQENPVREFVRDAIKSAKTRDFNAEYFFNETAKMEKDLDSPSELQEIGKVLHQILAGIKNPDLSGLPKHVAEFINRELEK